MSGDIEEFNEGVKKRIQEMGADKSIQDLGTDFSKAVMKHNYVYNFSWMGVPVIQFPQDIMAMQEIIWKVQPDTIIETGVARGGSIIFYASMLEMMGIANGQVVGIDIDIRDHNRTTIENHPTSNKIKLVEGSSIDQATVDQVKEIATGSQKTIVCLDAMHTHQHVLEELRLYSDLVTPGSYLVVFDTWVENLPEGFFADRPWGPGNNPKTAIAEFLKENSDFEVDHSISDKLLMTATPGGFLRRKG